MGNVEIVLNSAGIRELLKCPEIAAACDAEARRMTEATGVLYETDKKVGTLRVRMGARMPDGDALKLSKSNRRFTARRKKKREREQMEAAGGPKLHWSKNGIIVEE